MNLDTIFNKNGKLQKSLQDYTPRLSQIEMSNAVLEAIKSCTHLVVEAGTGTGKTFAYLAPVFLSNKKTIITTATRHLQDQLYFKDIPLIKNALSSSRKSALLKGRSNYFCHYRFKQVESGEKLLPKEQIIYISKLAEWKEKSKTGDIAELADIGEDNAIWPHVTSTIDSCLGQNCPFIKECFILKARRNALNADIIVVNHHLFLSDLSLQENGIGELLPESAVIIFDEAHALPELVSQFFGTKISSRQLLELARDCLTELAATCTELPEIADQVYLLQATIRQLHTEFGKENKRSTWPESLPNSLKHAITNNQEALSELVAMLENIAARSTGLETIYKHALTILTDLKLLTSQKTDKDNIRWYETYLNGFTLKLTPISISETLQPFLNSSNKTKIFTSATLAIADSFKSFVKKLGLESATKLQLASPFNYQEQAILYVPRGLPDPRTQQYTKKFIEAALPLLELTQGRTFILFTSHKAMNHAAELLESETEYTLLLQGTQPKKILLEHFKQQPNPILLGTASFWQGVDVKGDKLVSVMIDKLPFSSPDDPVLQARIKKMRAEGINPFTNYQLAEAILSLKQGAGRLIRSNKDRGILMVGDPRLVGARYANAFLNSLPPMPRTRDLKKVTTFFTQDKI